MAASQQEPAATCSEEHRASIMCSKSLLVKPGPLHASSTVSSQPTDASLRQATVIYGAAEKGPFHGCRPDPLCLNIAGSVGRKAVPIGLPFPL